MNPLRWLVRIFVNTFGITAPTPENEAKAGKVIALMLAAVAVALGMIAWLLRSSLTR
jgi:cytochrome b561